MRQRTPAEERAYIARLNRDWQGSSRELRSTLATQRAWLYNAPTYSEWVSRRTRNADRD